MQRQKRRWLRRVVLAIFYLLVIGSILFTVWLIATTRGNTNVIVTSIFALELFAFGILIPLVTSKLLKSTSTTNLPSIQELTQRTEHIYEPLPEDEKKLMLRIFSDLVHLGSKDEHEHIPDSPRPVPFEELVRDEAERDIVDRLVSQLANAHLLTVSATENKMVEIEDGAVALLTSWKPLRERLQEYRLFLFWYQELKKKVQAWIALNPNDITQRDTEGLLTLKQVFEAEEYNQKHPGELHTDALSFIRASKGYREQETERLQSLLKQSEQQQQILYAHYLALRSDKIRNEQPRELEQSVLSAKEALKLSHTLDADTALREGLKQLGQFVGEFQYHTSVNALTFCADGSSVAMASGKKILVWRVNPQDDTGNTLELSSHESEVYAATLCPHGRYVAAICANGSAHLWDTQEWRAEPTNITLKHPGEVRDIKFSSDGGYLATAGDNAITIWNVATASEYRQFKHGGSAMLVAFSPDRTYIAAIIQDAGSHSDIVRMWNILDKDERTLGIRGDPGALSFSYDGQEVIVICGGYGDYKVYVYGAINGELLRRYALNANVERVKFSPNGRYLAIASDRYVQLWDPVKGYPSFTSFHLESIIRAISFSPDGSLLVAACQDHTARVLETTSGQQLACFPHQDAIETVATAGISIATVTENHTIRIWETTRGDQQCRIPHGAGVNAICFSPHGNLIATASDDGTATVWKVGDKTGDVEELLKIVHQDKSRTSQSKVKTVTFSQNGAYVASAGEDGVVHVVDMVKQVPLRSIRHQLAVNAIAFSPDEGFLATASDDMTAKVCHLMSGHEILLKGHTEEVSAVAFHPDSKSVATASKDGTVRVWDLTGDQAQMQTCLPIEGLVLDVIFQPPDGAYLVTRSGHFKNPVQIWNTVNGQEVKIDGSKPDIALAIRFNQDGRYLAIGSRRQFNGVWNLENIHDKKSVPQFFDLSHESSAEAIAFSPDSQYLATAHNTTVQLWDITSSHLPVAHPSALARLAHKSKVTCVAFSPDGRYLATASLDGTAILWLWKQSDLIDAANSRLSRGFT